MTKHSFYYHHHHQYRLILCIKALASSVPPPPLAPPPPPPGTDALQDLLSRKQEAERNRARFHLTESDCNLILTNSTDYTYTGGQIIADEGQAINSVYRIKSGSVLLMKQGHKLYELIQVCKRKKRIQIY